MTSTLEHGRHPAASGRPDSLVVFLHGYGADGADLLGLAQPLAEHLPNTTFVAPNAPERCTVNPAGYQWAPIPRMDGSSVGDAEASLDRSIDTLQAFLDQVLVDEGIPADRCVLFGFSQGTMMALHVAPRRSTSIAGVVAFSGRLIRPEMLDEVQVRPPVVLIHGDQDDVVPPGNLPNAAQALQEAGWAEVYAHVMKGTGHGIAPDGLSVALAFIRKVLGA